MRSSGRGGPTRRISRPSSREERPGVGRAEERGGRPPSGRVRPPGGRGRRRSPGAPLLGVAPVRERVPALVQAGREDAYRRPRSQTLPPAGDSVCAVACVGRDSRRDEGPAPRAARDAGSTRAPERDSYGSTSPCRPGRGRDGPSDAATRRRARPVSSESDACVAGRRGTTDAQDSPETAKALADPARPLRDDVVPRR